MAKPKNTKHTYRQIGDFEDCINCECITCKGNFVTFDEDNYQYCPRCGIKLDGLHKKNPRYRVSYDGREYPHSENYFVVERKNPPGEYTFQSPYTKGWHLVTHCRVGKILCSGIPSSIEMYNVYQFECNKHKKGVNKVHLLIRYSNGKTKILMKNYQ
jgi:hypothetical protein